LTCGFLIHAAADSFLFYPQIRLERSQSMAWCIIRSLSFCYPFCFPKLMSECILHSLFITALMEEIMSFHAWVSPAMVEFHGNAKNNSSCLARKIAISFSLANQWQVCAFLIFSFSCICIQDKYWSKAFWNLFSYKINEKLSSWVKNKLF